MENMAGKCGGPGTHRLGAGNWLIYADYAEPNIFDAPVDAPTRIRLRIRSARQISSSSCESVAVLERAMMPPRRLGRAAADAADLDPQRRRPVNQPAIRRFHRR
jgi:hypothetical protein